MCGISGFFQFNKQIVAKEVLSKMLATQEHRGPDSNGTYYNNYVGFAHNRLSLLDLSNNGSQPFMNEDYVLVYNGELYNFLELKKELPDTHYKSNSDTEVLFNCLRFFGVEKTLEKIQGMFAFSWYDIKKDELYLVRDRIGIKPLFYGVDSNKCLWFSSEVKAILSSADFEPDPIQMLFSPIGGITEKTRHKTPWKNLYSLTPGSYLVIKDGCVTKKEYFDFAETISENEYMRLNSMSLNEVTDEFESIFDESVKRMLISDAPMGAFVSGGIDSSLIATYAAKHSSELKLFTANVLGKYSEFEDATHLANVLDKKLYSYDYKKEMGIRDLAKVTWHYESPLVIHFNAIPFSNISAVTREQEVKAVLTGEGADELFLGYPRLLTSKYDKFIRSPYALLNNLYNRIPALRRYMNTSESGNGILDIYGLAVQGYSRQMLRSDNLNAYSFLNKQQQNSHYLSYQMISESIISLLCRNDRMGMMYSVESRFPFLDEKVIAFALNLPLKFKIGRTTKFHNYKHPFLIDKHIVRHLGKRSLPSELYNKKKNGFPLTGTRDMTVKSGMFYNGVFADLMQMDKKQIDYMVSHSGKYHIALLALFEVWGKLFIEKRSIEEVDVLTHKFLSID